MPDREIADFLGTVPLLRGQTGADLEALIGVSGWLEGVLGRRLDGYVYRSGNWP